MLWSIGMREGEAGASWPAVLGGGVVVLAALLADADEDGMVRREEAAVDGDLAGYC